MTDLNPFRQKEATGYDDWLRSDRCHNSFLVQPDPALDDVNQIAAQIGLLPTAVSATQGKFLNRLVMSVGAKKVVEDGTLAGGVFWRLRAPGRATDRNGVIPRYNTIWMAKALPEDGKIVTFELEEKHAQVCQELHACGSV